MDSSNKYPPAAVQPMKTGIAPTNEPGTTAKEEILFKLVYSKLYHTTLNNPNKAGTIPNTKYK